MFISKRVFWIIVFSAYIIGITMGLLQSEPLLDESSFHMPFMKKLVDDFPLINLNYSGTASTPLAFIFLSAVGKVFGVNINIFRIITSLVSFLGFYLFYRILKSKGENYFSISLFLLFNPYFFRLSFTFYIGVWGVLFAMFSVYYALKSPSFKNSLLLGLNLAAAVLTQQFYIFLVPSLILMFYYFHNPIIRDRLALFVHIVIILIPQISYLLLFLFWKGMTSPEYQNVHIISIKLQNIFFFFVLVGFYFGWLSYNNLKFNKKYLFLLPTIPLFILYIPKYSGELRSGDMITGLIMSISDALKLFNENLQFIFLLLLFISGMILFVNNNTKDIWMLPLIFFIAMMAFNTVSGERYFISVIPFIILYLSERIKEFGNKLVYVFPVYAVLSVFYLFKWFFVTE